MTARSTSRRSASGQQDPSDDEDTGPPLPPAPLPDHVRRIIAAELATFRTSAEIRALLREKHGIEAAQRDVELFAEPLEMLFRQLATDHVEGEAGLHIAGLDYRLRRLQQLALLAEYGKDLKLAAHCLDQAAKDQRAGLADGGGERGGDGLPPLTPEQARKEIERFLRDRDLG